VKCYGLILATLGMTLLSGWALRSAGWFSRPVREPARPCRPHARSADPLASESAWRYRQCQPHHWRYLVMPH
jgi:hypothetical protein